MTLNILLFNTPFRLPVICQAFPNKQELKYLSHLPPVPTGLKELVVYPV